MLAPNFWMLLVVVLACVSTAVADGRTTPYETMYFYFAYKAEYAAVNGDKTKMTIAKACPGSPCTFQDFVKYVYKYPGKFFSNPLDLDTELKKNPVPSVEQLAVELQSAFQTPAESTRLDKAKLLTIVGDDNPNYNKMLKTVSGVLKSISLSQEQRDQVKGALGGIQQERSASSALGQDKALEAELKNRKPEAIAKLVYDTKKTPLGSSYQELNMDKTLANGLDKGEKTVLKSAYAKATNPANTNNKLHLGILNTVAEINDELNCGI